MWRATKRKDIFFKDAQTRSLLTSITPTAIILGFVLFGASGCLIDFPEKDTQQDHADTVSNGGTDSDNTDESGPEAETDGLDTTDVGDGGNDTGEDPDSDPTAGDSGDEPGNTGGDDSGDETGPENDFCPVGIDFTSKTAFTDLIESMSTVVENYNDPCGDNEVIVGYHGFFRDETGKNLVHGKIQALCAAASISLKNGECVVEMGTTTPSPLRGSVGNREWTRMCPEGQVIVGYQGTTGMDIDRIFFTCAPLLIEPEKDGHSITLGQVTYLDQAGGDGGNYPYQDECPKDQVATTSVTHTSNILLNGLGMGCRTPSLVY